MMVYFSVETESIPQQNIVIIIRRKILCPSASRLNSYNLDMLGKRLTVFLFMILLAECELPSQNPVIGIFTLPDKSDEPTMGQPYPPEKTS